MKTFKQYLTETKLKLSSSSINIAKKRIDGMNKKELEDHFKNLSNSPQTKDIYNHAKNRLEKLNKFDESVDLKFIAVNETDKSITVSINGQRYEYFWNDGDINKRWFKFKKQAQYKPGETLNQIKASATRFEKL